MTSMATNRGDVVIGGVDSHRDTLAVAAIDGAGRNLGSIEVSADTGGYRRAVAWLQGLGTVVGVGVEGTGCYGAGVARFMCTQQLRVIEVDRPDRRERRRAGKSDALDAYAAAAAVLSGRASGGPKSGVGPAEAVRALRIARRGAVKARTQAINTLKALVVTAPAPLRESLSALGDAALLDTCARLRPGPELGDPGAAVKTALRRLARRAGALTEEIDDADRDLHRLLQQATPRLLARPGIGPDVAATMLITAGDNPDRMRSDAAFARGCGSAPIPASSGLTTRHRLHRGGNRDANRALYVVAITRMRCCPKTRAYVERRTKEGLSRREIIRCLKRYIAREIYYLLRAETGS